MSTSDVRDLVDVRGQRRERVDRAFALHLPDPNRSEVLRHLKRVVELSGADRAATVWVDEYGPGLVHPRTVLDVGSDRPRRSFDLQTLRRAWEAGVPGVVDLPNHERILAPGYAARSSVALSLGSDGLRAWFVVADAATPRGRFDTTVMDELLFLAGECAAVHLHADLEELEIDEDGRRPAQRFTGWPVLRDLDDVEGTTAADHRRVACRFLVARAVRTLVDDDLAVDPESLDHQINGIRGEIGDFLADDPERDAWIAVLYALESRDLERIARTAIELGDLAEEMGHWKGALEIYGAAHEVAVGAGAVEEVLLTARLQGLVFRRMGEWDETIRWYGLTGKMGEQLDRRDYEMMGHTGVAVAHIEKGGMPQARDELASALDLFDHCDDRTHRGYALHAMMTVAHTEGRLADAARFGWRAFGEFERERQRMEALTGLGGVFLEARDLKAAELAFKAVLAGDSARVFRLYARAGLSSVAALRGDRRGFEEAIRRLDEEGFEAGPVVFRAEALLERGDGYLSLGDEEKAREWYQRAVELSDELETNEYLIRAEHALHRLEGVRRGQTDDSDRKSLADAPLLPVEEMAGIREGLSSLVGSV